MSDYRFAIANSEGVDCLIVHADGGILYDGILSARIPLAEIQQAIVRNNAQKWLHMDVRPFPEIRSLIEKHPGCTLDDVQELEVGALTRDEPPEGKWRRNSFTGERWCNIEFSDRWLCFSWKDQDPVQFTETMKSTVKDIAR